MANIIKDAGLRTFHYSYGLMVKVAPFPKPKLITDGIESLVSTLKLEHIHNVLIITGPNILKRGLPNELIDNLQNCNINTTVFSDTISDPTVETVEQALRKYYENNCDGIIAFGGGSPMDCAKIVAARVARPNLKVTDMAGLMKIHSKLPVLVAVPTTAGTGSETTMVSIIKDVSQKKKLVITDFCIVPKYAYLNPNVTVSLPADMTATTGMDALTHAVEAYIGNANSKETLKWAKDAIKLIFENLETAYNDGNNLEARKNMQLASFYAGEAFTRACLGYVHGVAHSLGGYYGVPHGLANAIILPVVLEEYGESAWKKLAQLADHIGITNANDTNGQKATKFITAIKNLNTALNIPTTIDCIDNYDIPTLAQRAYEESTPLYPVPRIMNAKELQTIYHNISNT